VSDVTLLRWLRDRLFPAPAVVIGIQRYWRAADIAEWQAGRRDWPADPNADARRQKVRHLLDALHRRHAARKAAAPAAAE
jgi:hypothetical protein